MRRKVYVTRDTLGVVVHRHAKGASTALLNRLSQAVPEGRLFVVASPQELVAAVQQLRRLKVETVYCGGGDGTLALVLAAFIKHQKDGLPRFALLPLGTGNALAHWVCTDKAVDALVALCRDDNGLSAYERVVPLVRQSGSEHVFCFGGMGYDSLLLSDYNTLQHALEGRISRTLFKGLLGYATSLGLKTLPKLLRRPLPMVARITAPQGAHRNLGPNRWEAVPPGGVLFDGPLSLLAVGTSPFYGYGLKMFPHVEAYPQKMHVRLASMGPLGVLRHLPAIWRGSYQDQKLLDFVTTRIAVQLREPFAFQAQGEEIGPVASTIFSLSGETISLLDSTGPFGH